MGHGSYGRKRAEGRSAFSKSSVRRQQKKQGLEAQARQMKRKPKAKTVSIKNQIRSVERLLKKDLPREVREAQEKRIAELKKEAYIHATSELERKMAVRYRKVKFFERRKIERLIRRLEKQQRVLSESHTLENSQQAENITKQLAQLQEDLEYVRFFPKTQKYISLFVGNDDESVVIRRREFREKIKSNLAAAAATGVELEETGSEDDLPLDVSEDDFFVSGKGSGDADADDEWTDKSLRLVDKSKHKEKEPLVFSDKPPATRFKDYESQTSANFVSMSLDGPRKVLNKLSGPGKVEVKAFLQSSK